MKLINTHRWLLAATIVAVLTLPLSVTIAQGKGKGGGGKGGGSKGGFRLVELPDVNGSTGLEGYAEGLNEIVNSNGSLTDVEVVGILGSRAHYWQLDAQGDLAAVIPLPLPAGADPGVFTSAKDINSSGLISGSAGQWPNHQPVVWPNVFSEPRWLPLPDGFVGGGTAVSVNNLGLIAGWLRADDGIESVVVWGLRPDGTIAGPQVLASGDAWAPDVNDLGGFVATIDLQAYRWQIEWGGQSLVISPPAALFAEAMDNGTPVSVALQTVTAINEQGDVCGGYLLNGWRTYLLTAQEVLIDMPPLVDNRRIGTRNYQASSLNDAVSVDRIQVVGEGDTYRKKSGTIERTGIELLWQGGQAVDLEQATDLGESSLSLEWFQAIGNHGWLAGYGQTAAQARPIVLVPK